MGYKGKTDKEYQRQYYLKNKYRCQEYRREYQREYNYRNRDEILLTKAEYYINKVRERNENKDNVVISSNKIIISILED